VFDLIRDVLGTDTGPSDAHLLEAFTRAGQEAAFDQLVRRHGRLVWSVCRRVLRDPHDAEDAFQATFLVLARKASSIRKQSSVGSWLHGVAYRLSSRMRHRLEHRHRHERPGPAETQDEQTDSSREPVQELSLREALAILDEEVDRLPEKFRAPVVLYYLQGKTNEEAARELRCPAGTLKSRLLRARELLCARLTQRGVALSAASLSVLLATTAEAAMAPAPLRAVVTGALAFVRGGAAPVVPVQLARAFIRTMTMNKIGRIAVALLVLGLLASAAGVLVHQAVSGAPPIEPAADKDRAQSGPTRARADANGDALPPGALARLGTLRLRHGARVNAVAFAAGGKEIITAGPDGVVRIWDTATGKELRRAGTLPKTGVAEGFFQRPVSFSVDGGRAATAGENGTLIVWDLATGRELRRFKVEPSSDLVTAILTPDGKALLISSLGGKVVLWDVATGKEVRRFEVKILPREPPLDFGGAPPAPPFGVGGLVCSPDGRLLAAPFIEGREVGVRLWDVSTGKEARRAAETMKGSNDFPPNVPHPAFSSNGRVIARVALDGTIRLHSTTDGKELRSLETPAEKGAKALIAGLVIAPDGKTLAALCADRSVRLYDTATGKERRTLGEGARPTGVGPVPPVFDEPQYSPDAAPLAFSPDGKVLAVASAGNTVRLWDVNTAKPLPSPAGHAGAVLGIGVSADGKTVVTLGADGTLRRWETATGKELQHLRRPDDASVLSVSSGGRLLARLVDAKTIALRDLATDKDTHRIGLPPDTDATLAGDPTQFFCFSDDEKLLAVRDQLGVVHLWDTTTGKALPVLAAPQDEKDTRAEYPSGLALTRDGRTMLTIGLLGDDSGLALSRNPNGQRTRLRLWDTKTGTMLRRWEVSGMVAAASFTENGRSLAIVNEEGVGLWEVASGQLRYHRKGQAMLVACSPDCRTLAVATGSTVRLIDLRSDREIAQFAGHQADVSALAFTRDGKALVSASTDSTALVWDVASQERPAAKVDEPDARRLAELWKDLRSDAVKAYQAAVELSASPKAAVVLLAERLKPVAEPDAKTVARRIADLDSDSFDVRQEAADALKRFGELARPALVEALKKGPSAEARRHIEELLAGLRPGVALSADDLQLLRAVEVLAWIGTPSARKLLQDLAHGAAGARLTRAAAASLQRTGE
jgi:RNA polymerase sigma factor (sigma-70 family)